MSEDETSPTQAMETNRKTWDAWTDVNFESEFYGVDAFREGRTLTPALDALEIELLGDVTGLSLLHLQCHFGMDTLTWARRGATVTGIDFSGRAIQRARGLASEIGVRADFHECNVYDTLAATDGAQFDIVFTSIGAINWLPDLDAWAEVVARSLRPAGRFLILEGHPLAHSLNDESQQIDLTLRYPYFSFPALRIEETGVYSDSSSDLRTTSYFYQHGLHEILSPLIERRLVLERFEEYPYLAWPVVPWLEGREDGTWHLPQGVPQIPLMFSALFRKPSPNREDAS